MKRLGGALVVLFLVGVVAAAAARWLLFELATVSSDEMAPGLRAGDTVVVLRHGRRPRRGDLILFSHPEQPDRLAIRRVVGLPGDVVEVQGGHASVVGVAGAIEPRGSMRLDGGGPPRSYLRLAERLDGAAWEILRDPARQPRPFRAAPVERGLFVLADHRDHGRDSRGYGAVPATAVRGVVVHVLRAARPSPSAP